MIKRVVLLKKKMSFREEMADFNDIFSYFGMSSFIKNKFKNDCFKKRYIKIGYI